jgi:hypothetical protein
MFNNGSEKKLRIYEAVVTRIREVSSSLWVGGGREDVGLGLTCLL